MREVDLVGEAYFDVVKSAGRPFIVHTKAIDIRVLGTSFNIKCYPHENTEATLIKGLIQIIKNDNDGDSLLTLHPHEKVIVSRLGVVKGNDPPDPVKTTALVPDLIIRPLKKNTADTSIVETAWVYNKLVFDGQQFGEIADEMERWFNVKMIFHDQDVKKYRFHARFENETVSEVLAALRLSTAFTFKINDNEINIYKK
jgi:ferric-dicitrate binding protein FerR (iron transport regulator)